MRFWRSNLQGHRRTLNASEGINIILRPNLINYINISKFLDNEMSRRKCTGGNSRRWDWAGVCVRGGGVETINFSLKNIPNSNMGFRVGLMVDTKNSKALIWF